MYMLTSVYSGSDFTLLSLLSVLSGTILIVNIFPPHCNRNHCSLTRTSSQRWLWDCSFFAETDKAPPLPLPHFSCFVPVFLLPPPINFPLVPPQFPYFPVSLFLPVIFCSATLRSPLLVYVDCCLKQHAPTQ